MIRRVYQQYAGPVLSNTPELPVVLPAASECNWVRVNRLFRPWLASLTDWGVLTQNPAAPVTVDQWLESPPRPRMWPRRYTVSPHAWLPNPAGTGTIVPDGPVLVDPTIFLTMGYETEIAVTMEYETEIAVTMHYPGN